MIAADYEFVPMGAADLPLVRRWLETPHVSEWWHDPADQFDPNSVGIARKGELIAILLERLHFRMRPACDDFPKRLVDVAHPECEVV